MKTKIIHHISRDFTHKVVETQTLFYGYVVKTEFSNAIVFKTDD
ncbi:hypothetical protein OIU80_19705 [Flavobacterium sp. LS1R47]|uniref:Uncharacterized protein n=1 Tax=Flavobacterium frigoritolerans TaxID=2987686 RepID=A0A9X3CAF4_9FLAO|nr:hypothetical protein [Flavobacterium frigoritolerans]MCV9934512.1 hypothetical protein [Flavobacterium frigoritolerans]